MRRLILSGLIRICTVCHFLIDFWLKPIFAAMDVSKFVDGRPLLATRVLSKFEDGRPLFATVDVSKFIDGRVHIRNPWVKGLMPLHQGNYSTRPLWTGLLPIARWCLVNFYYYYYYVLQKFLNLIKTVQRLIWICTVCRLPFWDLQTNNDSPFHPYWPRQILLQIV